MNLPERRHDTSHKFYSEFVSQTTICKQTQNEILQQAWKEQKGIVKGFVDLMYPLVQLLRIQICETQPSSYVPSAERPKNRNRKMNRTQQRHWIYLMQHAINHHLAGETQKVKEIQKTFRDLLLNDCDFDFYLNCRDLIGDSINTEWLPEDQAKRILKKIDKHIEAFRVLENRFLPQYYPFARKIAGKAELMGRPIDDFLQEAILGIVVAFRKYSPTKGYEFSTHAQQWISGRTSDYLHRHDPLIRRDASFASIKREVNIALKDLGRSMSEFIVDADLQTMVYSKIDSKWRISDIDSFVSCQRSLLSINYQTNEDGGGSLEEVLPAEAPSQESVSVASEMMSEFESVLIELEPRDAYVYTAHIGEGYEKAAANLVRSNLSRAMDSIRLAAKEAISPLVSAQPKPLALHVFNDSIR